jgi:phosphoenolpyruvate carboxylase
MVSNGELRDRIHGEIASEHTRALDNVLKVCSQKEILDSHRVLRDSIRQRNPYVDPLHYLQMRFLAEMRDRSSSLSDEHRKKIDEILLLTVNGIAFGMKSTG